MPGAKKRWFFCALGSLGAVSTSRYRGPLCMQRSVRLFLVALVGAKAGQESLTNDAGSVAIGVVSHITAGAIHEGRARRVA